MAGRGDPDHEDALERVTLPAPPPIPEGLKPARSGGASPVKEKGLGASMAEVGRAWALAFDFMLTIAAGAGLGWALGRWFGSQNNWIMIGFVLGFATALYRIIRHTQKQEARERAERAGRGGGGGA
ncbi:MAG: AtpZ/AtpI family protein [Phycisphaeraceae bacterium]|nr:MAG: AtpZ/AtpI family protein [Phycisphaeraceae bacterium]